MNRSVRRSIGAALVIGTVGAGAACSESNDSEDAGTIAAAAVADPACTNLEPVAVTASGDDGNVAANVNDDDLATRWSGPGKGAFVQFDLGRATSLCKARVAWFRGDERINHFTIAVSDDGASFRKIYGDDSSGKRTTRETYVLPKTTGRFLRITVDGNTQNDWASITELAVLGSAVHAPPPPPPPPADAGPPPSGSAKPDATNTGVKPGTVLTVVDGDQTITTSNRVIEAKDFHGFVTVHADNVTFRNCVFRGRATNFNASLFSTEEGATNITVEDSEVVPSNPSATIDGMGIANTNVYRVNVHGSVDGIKAYDNTLVQDSYIHDMKYFASDPNQGGGPTHNDGVQLFGGVTNVTLRNDNIVMNTTTDNAALQSSARNVLVEHSWLSGGGCTLNFAGQGAPLPNVNVVDNRFGPSFFDCPILISTTVALASNSGNVWDATGQPIPPPQQHD